jgi:two-component system CheB/CheR fusion protein
MPNLIKMDFRIIAIGASAGGVEAFESLFKTMPATTGFSFVVVTHLLPKHTSVLTEIISKFSRMQVFTIQKSIEIEKNCIYVLPPDKNVEIKHGNLLTVKQSEPHYDNRPVDHFFKSLAQDQGDRSIAVVLSGSGSDGTMGMRSIKKAGGIVIVQNPDTARFEGMPQSAVDTHLADFVLPINLIIKEIITISKKEASFINPKELELKQILKLLELHTGHDFSDYKVNTINRRIVRQMQRYHVDSLQDYINLLSQQPEYLDFLFKDLLIGVTCFFRDNNAFEALKKIILQQLSIKKSNIDSFRIWIPGCSTGEEAYTIAIILLECVASLKLTIRIQIFATDIDHHALEFARIGRYHKTEVADLSRERLDAFFSVDNNHFKLNKEVRQIITFGFQNVILDPPFTKLDLISCRNLLIYFNTTLQKRLFRLFHYSLGSNGVLFLGTSEAVVGHNGLFRLIRKEWKIYERNDAGSNSAFLLSYPSVKRYAEHKIPLAFKTPLLEDKSDSGNFIAKHFLGAFTSASLLITNQGKILYAYGNIYSFLKDFNTESQNLFELISTSLKNKLIAAIKKSLNNQIKVSLTNLKLKIGAEKTSFNIIILPTPEIESEIPLVCIFFQTITAKDRLDFVLKEYGTEIEIAKKIIDVQQELQFTKETLQSTIEELQSNNEELQSTNEELQSTVEEIETSKEELLSLNEELIIVNSELQTRIDHSVSATEDLINLFNSTQIIAIFLDNKLCVRLFTPYVETIMNLRPNDIGRPWHHFATNLNYNNFNKNIEEVINDSKEMTFEVESFEGHWFQVRVIPYLTLLKTIDGVIITFTDITDYKKCLAALQKTTLALELLKEKK